MENPSSNWSDLLASSVVTQTPLPVQATQGLCSAFLDANVSELRIILAQGSHHELAIYPIISKGAINLDDMDPIGYLPLDTHSIAMHAMKHCAAVSPHWPRPHAPGDPKEPPPWVDWEEMKQFGCDWALAAPMACTSPHCCERLLGAVLIAGKNLTISSPSSSSSAATTTTGQQFIGPSINPEWLKEWSCELAQGIAHTSVSIMESSLEVLQLLYPPQVVEALVYKAIAPGGHPEESEHLTELLQVAAATRDAEDDAIAAVAAFSPSSARTTLNISSGGPAGGQNPSEDTTLASSATQESYSPTKNTVNTVTVRNIALDHDFPPPAGAASGAAPGQGCLLSPVQYSPFATLSATNPTPFSPASPAPASITSTTGAPATTGNSSERTSTDSHEDRGISSSLSFNGRSPSRRVTSRSHMAAAVLRQASLQSRSSLMNSVEDLASMSPANSEVEGYEDLLSDDMKARLMTRPSYQIDRAHSYESVDSGCGDVAPGGSGSGGLASPRAALIAVEEARGGVQKKKKEDAERQSSKVPVVLSTSYAANNNEEEQNRARSGSAGAPHYENGSPTAAATMVHHPTHRTFHEHQYAYSQQNHPHYLHQEQHMHPNPHSLSTISEGGSRGSSHPDLTMSSRSLSSQLNSSLPSNSMPSPLNISLPTTPSSSLHWDQEWDLAFSDSRVEQRFKNHLLPKVVTVEAFIGAVLFFGAVIFFSFYPAFLINQDQVFVQKFNGELFQSKTALIFPFPLILLFTLPLFAILGAQETYTQHRTLILLAVRFLFSLFSATWLVSIGFASLQAIPLGLISLTNPMRLRFHIPLQLLCMWAAIQPGITAFIIAFVVPTAVIYAVERRLRRQFQLDAFAAAAAAAAVSGSCASVGARSAGFTSK